MHIDERTERLWPNPDDGPWRLTLFWERRNARPEPVGIQLVLGEWEHGKSSMLTLTTSTLREVRVAEIVAEERERLAHMPVPRPTPDVVVAGMRPATRRRLERVAEVYQEAWRAGEPPTKEVARRLNVTAPAAGNLVRRAREAGFLPPTSAGVPQA